MQGSLEPGGGGHLTLASLLISQKGKLSLRLKGHEAGRAKGGPRGRRREPEVCGPQTRTNEGPGPKTHSAV